VFLGIDNSRARGRPEQPLAKLTFFASYWIDNRTGMDLVFQDHAAAAPNSLLLGARMPGAFAQVLVPGELMASSVIVDIVLQRSADWTGCPYSLSTVLIIIVKGPLSHCSGCVQPCQAGSCLRPPRRSGMCSQPMRSSSAQFYSTARCTLVPLPLFGIKVSCMHSSM
jgi:hypothetical protein